MEVNAYISVRIRCGPKASALPEALNLREGSFPGNSANVRCSTFAAGITEVGHGVRFAMLAQVVCALTTERVSSPRGPLLWEFWCVAPCSQRW